MHHSCSSSGCQSLSSTIPFYINYDVKHAQNTKLWSITERGEQAFCSVDNRHHSCSLNSTLASFCISVMSMNSPWKQKRTMRIIICGSNTSIFTSHSAENVSALLKIQSSLLTEPLLFSSLLGVLRLFLLQDHSCSSEMYQLCWRWECLCLSNKKTG